MFGFAGSIVSRVTYRFGSGVEPLSTCVQIGETAVPFVVLNTSPLSWPTQMMSEFPPATAMALIGEATELGPLIDAHDGPVVAVFGVVASLVRQSDTPPARSRVGTFGSRMNGAMKFACPRMPPPEQTSGM